MEQVFESVKDIEKQIAGFISQDEKTAEAVMIENAAVALEKYVRKACSKTKSRVTVLCGSGNNGADGYTLCRRLAGSCRLNVIKVKNPKSFHCISASDNLINVFQATSSDIYFYDLNLMQGSTSVEKVISKSDVVVDCIFGTGFHGTVDSNIQKLFEVVNNSKAYRIACDIPSGLDVTGENISSLTLEEKKKVVFAADRTVSMLALKIGLFSDAAKDIAGKISVCAIGVSDSLFRLCSEKVSLNNKIYLLEKSDVKCPVRKEENVHKGKFGHICVMAGDKAGAAILSSAAGLKTGAGLASVVVNNNCDYEHFKIPASIMISSDIPSTATAVVVGPGFGRNNDFEKVISELKIMDCPDKAFVFDADSFYYKELIDFLIKNSSEKNSCKIVLTPHPKEFANLLNLAGLGDFSVKQVCDNRLELSRKFCEKFTDVVLVLKGANSFITVNDTTYICNSGSSSLAKGGSGDVLSGVIASLLAQKYDARDAAIHGVLMHALASRKVKKNYSLTPELLIENL